MTPNLMGFTLIELLVVVLIIGILAAVAVPQYQKAVEKSKSTQALTLLKSVAQSAQVYYLANGEFPLSFAEMDIDIPWTGKQWGMGTYPVDVRSNDEWSLQISRHNGSDGNFYDLWLTRLSGPYAGAGFVINLYSSGKEIPIEKAKCTERKNNGIIFSAAEGDYCKKIFNGTLVWNGTYRGYNF